MPLLSLLPLGESIRFTVEHTMVFIVEGLYPTNDPQSSDDEDAPRTAFRLDPAALLRAQAAAREERRVADDPAKARRAAELRAALKKELSP